MTRGFVFELLNPASLASQWCKRACAAWVIELRKRRHFELRPWREQGTVLLRETADQ